MLESTAYLKTPKGILKIAATQNKITMVQFTKKVGTPSKQQPPVLRKCLKQLTEYFEGKRKTFDIPLHLEGTDFQVKVWKALQKIPYGQTKSYADMAKMVKSPKAFRAVGNANNKNNISIILPCHRVIGSDGKMVGYASGVKRKEWLLKHEKN